MNYNGWMAHCHVWFPKGVCTLLYQYFIRYRISCIGNTNMHAYTCICIYIWLDSVTAFIYFIYHVSTHWFAAQTFRSCRAFPGLTQCATTGREKAEDIGGEKNAVAGRCACKVTQSDPCTVCPVWFRLGYCGVNRTSSYAPLPVISHL